MNQPIQIISAPSLLGLQADGVHLLGDTLLANGLAEKIGAISPIKHALTLNNQRSHHRDPVTLILNPIPAHEFSITLGDVIVETVQKKHFALTLGGDCSILIGIMQGLKSIGTYGLIFFDAHADFYEPEKSTTGELADMDLAIVTGRGPTVVTNINKQQPYVKDENVIHIGQRDWEETKKYGSQDIRDTNITCISLEEIEKNGDDMALQIIMQQVNSVAVGGFWIHFDTDVLNDAINPAVDYRLAGGLSFEQIEFFIQHLLQTRKIIGMSVTIYNPSLDADGSVGKNITSSLSRLFSLQNL